MSNLQILSSSIRQLDNLYSLTDLHKASGGDEKHKPILFLRLEQTKDLISEVENDKVQICTMAVKTVRGGTNPSTYACKEIVIAYAAWISPQFHLVVLRAFLDKLEHSQKIQPNLPLEPIEPKYPEQLTAKEIHNLVWLWYSQVQMNELLGHLVDPLDKIGSRFSPTVYSHHHEYKRQYQQTLPTLRRLVQHLKKDNPLEWERLHFRLDQIKG